MQYLFVVAVGRSGSTLLQSLLNCLDGVSVRGENGLVIPMADGLATFKSGWEYAINGLPQTMRSELSANNKRKPLKTNLRETVLSLQDSTQCGHPWYGIHNVQLEQLTKNLRQLINSDLLFMKSSDEFVGFKEIRWHFHRNVFEGMEMLFPNAKYVFNFRSSNDIAESGWWRDDPLSLQTIENAQSWMMTEAIKLGDRALVVNYEDYSDDLGGLKPVELFLGKSFNPKVAKNVLKRRLRH